MDSVKVTLLIISLIRIQTSTHMFKSYVGKQVRDLMLELISLLSQVRETKALDESVCHISICQLLFFYSQ